MLGFDESLEAGEARLPERSIFTEPCIDGAQRTGIQFVDAMASLAALADEARATQQAQVPGNRGTGDGKGLRDTSGRLAAAAQQIEDGATCGIGERAESRIRRICNRTVTHYV
jgi:hypothetical protein